MTVTDDINTELPLDRDHPLLESIKGIKIIDVDTHLTEPGDLWTSRAPAKFKDLVPRVVHLKNSELAKLGVFRPKNTEDSDSSPVWMVGEDIPLGFAGGASVVNKSNQKVRGADFVHWPLTEVSPAASLVEPRLTLMDEVGIWGQILYPNAVGFGGQSMARIQDPELRLTVLQIWNDAMAEMQEQSGGRIMGLGIAPWWDIDVAVKEIERIHALGLHGINTNADPQNQGHPDLSAPYYRPFWDACESFDLSVNFHIGASVSQSSYAGDGPWPSLDWDTQIALGSTMLYIGNARVISNIIYSGLLDRHPRLKIVSVESGVGWIPFILDALDYQAVENNVDHLSMKPSDYFRRNIHACFWFESQNNFLNDISRIGIDNCMFETDFPHPTCLYPQPLNGIAKVLGENDVPWEDRVKLLSGNAARVYNIDVPTD
ncbi:amidohydrolase family protein [Amycolatopsis sp. NEAU-NG30]|uniref:Amidohydrolase family protein n=1 Tax=Amycolatopsis melonis TaxID=3156488 RepID=A0ABV0L8J1_9PSEU